MDVDIPEIGLRRHFRRQSLRSLVSGGLLLDEDCLVDPFDSHCDWNNVIFYKKE